MRKEPNYLYLMISLLIAAVLKDRTGPRPSLQSVVDSPNGYSVAHNVQEEAL